MIKVFMGNNVTRTEEILESSTTIRAALDLAGIDYTIGLMNLNGTTLKPDDLDKTFDDFEITESCFLLNVVKADNAA